jgi:hypothetical protein
VRRAPYGLYTPSLSAGAGIAPVPVSIALKSLHARTHYYYRLLATNAIGGSMSSAGMFTTLAGPGAVKVRGKFARIKGKRAAVKLSCAKASAGCAGTLKLTGRLHGAKGKRTLGSVRFALHAGRLATLKIKLSRAALVALAAAKHKRLTVAVVIRRSDGARGMSTKLVLRI